MDTFRPHTYCHLQDDENKNTNKIIFRGHSTVKSHMDLVKIRRINSKISMGIKYWKLESCSMECCTLEIHVVTCDPDW